MKVILLIVVLVIVAVPAYFYFTSTGTAIDVNPPVKVIGFETPVHLHLVNPHGLRSLTLSVEQDGKSYPENVAPKNDVTVKVGKQSTPSLHDGKARLIVTAVSHDLRRKTDSKSIDVDVITAAPRVVADGVQHYINQGRIRRWLLLLVRAHGRKPV